MKKGFIKSLVAICVAIMFFMPYTAVDTPALASAATTKTLDAGSTWVVNETTSLTNLTIADGATIKAPEGYSVTLTVDGVGTAIKPGAYKGKILITVTKEIIVPAGRSEPYIFKTAVYVKDGKYVAEKSVAATVAGGKVTDTSANDIKITSNEEKFNGIMITGDSRYSVRNPKISLTGNGGSDMVGWGAAIASNGNAEVTIEKANIVTHGCIRTAIFVDDNSTMHVNDSSIEVYNGTLPAGYVFSLGGEGGAMMSVPWMLGLTGNVRATNLVKNGTAYYNNTHIKAQGWGALSTDQCRKGRLYATNCLIETVESGYGAFTIDDCIDKFSSCTFNVADMAVISQNGDAVFTDGTVVNSRRFGAMFWGEYSSGDLTIDKGSVFNTKSTAIQVKGCGVNIVVDNAKLNPQNGIIIQAMESDDPNQPRDNSLSATPSSGRASSDSGRGSSNSGGISGAGRTSGGGGSSDVSAAFSNMTLNGDIINGNTTFRAMTVNFKNATITGAITTATVKHALGPKGEEITSKTPELYHLVGEVNNTYCATNEKYGVNVSLDGKSTWIVGKTSYLTSLTVAEGATIKAPKGDSVTLTVDGVETAIKPGTFKGKIVLKVTKIA